MRSTAPRIVQELLSIKQAADICNRKQSEIADALRSGQLQIHSVGGPVFFRHPENMPIYHSDHAYVTRSELDRYFDTQVKFSMFDERKSRLDLLKEIGTLRGEPAHLRRKTVRDILAVFEGAAHDNREDRYLAGARDVLREVCHRESVWRFKRDCT